jgi:hypothetical protein
MYTNISIHEVQNVARNIIDKKYNISQEMKIVIINIRNIILEQNYIEHNRKWYKHNDGLAMAAPTSAILAETFRATNRTRSNRGHFE